jgi:hypothetical protein
MDEACLSEFPAAGAEGRRESWRRSSSTALSLTVAGWIAAALLLAGSILDPAWTMGLVPEDGLPPGVLNTDAIFEPTPPPDPNSVPEVGYLGGEVDLITAGFGDGSFFREHQELQHLHEVEQQAMNMQAALGLGLSLFEAKAFYDALDKSWDDAWYGGDDYSATNSSVNSQNDGPPEVDDLGSPVDRDPTPGVGGYYGGNQAESPTAPGSLMLAWLVGGWFGHDDVVSEISAEASAYLDYCDEYPDDPVCDEPPVDIAEMQRTSGQIEVRTDPFEEDDRDQIIGVPAITALTTEWVRRSMDDWVRDQFDQLTVLHSPDGFNPVYKTDDLPAYKFDDRPATGDHAPGTTGLQDQSPDGKTATTGPGTTTAHTSSREEFEKQLRQNAINSTTRGTTGTESEQGHSGSGIDAKHTVDNPPANFKQYERGGETTAKSSTGLVPREHETAVPGGLRQGGGLTTPHESGMTGFGGNPHSGGGLMAPHENGMSTFGGGGGGMHSSGGGMLKGR